jgi:hypothetical protein
VVRAQIVFDDGSQSLTFERGLCNFQHAASHLVECPCHGFDEQVVLALEMPVEAPFVRPTFFITVPMPLLSPPCLRKRTSGHGKNVLVILRFVP